MKIKLTVTDESFWRFVDEAQWTTDHNVDRIKRFLLQESDEATVEALRHKASELMHKLEHYRGPDISGVSDDGWSDVRAHVIGSGRDVYEACIDSQLYIQEIVNSGKYVENFLYSLPYDDDWTTIERAPEKAAELIQALDEMDPQPTAAVDRLILADVVTRLEHIRLGEYEAAVDGWDKSLYSLWNNDFARGHTAPNMINDIWKYHV